MFAPMMPTLRSARPGLPLYTHQHEMRVRPLNMYMHMYMAVYMRAPTPAAQVLSHQAEGLDAALEGILDAHPGSSQPTASAAASGLVKEGPTSRRDVSHDALLERIAESYLEHVRSARAVLGAMRTRISDDTEYANFLLDQERNHFLKYDIACSTVGAAAGPCQ